MAGLLHLRTRCPQPLPLLGPGHVDIARATREQAPSPWSSMVLVHPTSLRPLTSVARRSGRSMPLHPSIFEHAVRKQAPERLRDLCLAPRSDVSYVSSPDDWRDEAMYFVLIDRFNRGYGALPCSDPLSPTSVHGGNINGVTAKLDMNPSAKAEQARNMWIDATLSAPGTELVDALDPTFHIATHAGDGGRGAQIDFDVPAKGVRVLVRRVA